MKTYILLLISFLSGYSTAFPQNPLVIPPVLSGTVFNLNIQNGTTQFYPGITSPTYGINGNILAPTLILNKWDWVTMNVTNNLTGNGNSTTIHWHGLHLPSVADGGPHQVINQGTTWSPTFQVLNSAGTYWYHPHGDGKTELHVTKGIAGMIIIKDSAESALNLPRTYGTDDFPVIVQTKAFDILYQPAIASQEDTAVMVNGVVHASLDAPAQVIRLRLLNGSSSRIFNFGFTGNMPFTQIGTDGGLLDAPHNLSRLMLAPGERSEILIDLQGMAGQTLYLKSFGSELTNGYYGAATVTGPMGGVIMGYDQNPLNGADFDVLQINVVAQTSSPVVTIPSSLVTNTPYPAYTNTRIFQLQPDPMMDPTAQVEGPFTINGLYFDMSVINETVYVNTTEKWRVTNMTGIAHPFHVHDVQFYIDNINGGPVPAYLSGKKDVVVVPPMQYVEFVTRFSDFTNDTVPYMYHCHMLHHEDDGMMGSFRVIDSTSGTSELSLDPLKLFPNPVSDQLTVEMHQQVLNGKLAISNSMGQIVLCTTIEPTGRQSLDLSMLPSGVYQVQLTCGNRVTTQKLIKL